MEEIIKNTIIKYSYATTNFNCNNNTITVLCKNLLKLIEYNEFNYSIWYNLFNNFLESNDNNFINNVCVSIYNRFKLL